MTSALVVATAGPALAAAGCAVTYTANSWSNGFTANVNITNLGDPIDGWNLEFDFPDDQQITQAWNGQYQQSGQHVVLSNVGWNKDLGTNASVTPGFQATYSGGNTDPSGFTLNGVACTGQLVGENNAPTVEITSPRDGEQFVAPASIPMVVAAQDPDEGDSVTRVEFYRDGMLAGTSTTEPFALTLNRVPVGDYELVAKAYDTAGAVGTSTPVTVSVVPTTEPHVVVSVPSVTVKEGATASVEVALSQAPTASTAVSVARSDGDEDITVTGGSSLLFTPDDWDSPQAVELSAAEDADADNGEATITATADAGFEPGLVTALESDNDVPGGTYAQEFNEMYDKLHNPANGYFSPEGVPYHSIETLMVEAPDHGHETTSEAFSYFLWLEAQHGRLTKDWAPFNNAWTTMEKYIIPSGSKYRSGGYNPDKPATYAPESEKVTDYPAKMDSGVTAGKDPLFAELKSTYRTEDVYGMHWLLDVDNVYGYGECGDGTSKPAYINTYQRGAQESVWETVPHPSCETFTHGNPSSGFLPIFIQDSQYSKQWRFTNAPDADARAIEAAYWALTWATEQGKASEVEATIAKAAKMGDYLRYAMYDKYFKKQGCTSPSCTPGNGKDSSAYLLSWYYAWGGSLNGDWSWRIGSSFNHQGYQNPMAAYVLSTVSSMVPKSPTAKTDWATSLSRQIEFYTWLQSAEGAIAGGATNSVAGAYKTPPTGTPTFYGMAYDEDPVYHDPPSNQWFGMQAWGMERMAEYYYSTGDPKAKAVLDKWVDWALGVTRASGGADYQIPSTLVWTGKPGGSWKAGTSSVDNSGLHVSVKDYTQDVGVTGALARVFVYYGAKADHADSKAMAKRLLDGLLANKDAQGISVAETRTDYKRFADQIYVPSTYTGTMANGDPINSASTFASIRTFYEQDPDWEKVQSYLNGGAAPTFNYHRFWAQADIALALADYGMLIGQ